MRKTNRMIAMALAAAVTTSVVPTTAFAEGADTGSGSATTTTNHSDGSTTSTTPHSDGSSTSTTTSSTTSTSGDGTSDSPAVSTTVNVTVTVNTDSNGNETGSNTTTETNTTETTDSNEKETKTVESAGGGSVTSSTPEEDNNTPDEPTGDPDGTFTGTDGEPVDDETAEYLQNFNEGTTTTTTTETDLNHQEEHEMEYDGKDRPTHETGSASGSTTTTTTVTTVVRSETEPQQFGEPTTELMDEAEQPQGTDREWTDEGTFGEPQNEYKDEPMDADELPGGDIPENDEQDLTASINGAAGAGASVTTEETLASDWTETYHSMVTDAMNKVKETAANETVADKKNNDAAVSMTEGAVEGHTNPENNADGDYKYRYTGETDTDTYEKVVTIAKTTDANGNVTFTTTTEVIVTPKAWTNEQTVEEEQLKEDEYAYTYGEVEESEPVVTYEVKLPARPALGEVTTDADGKTMTVVEVRDHFEEVNGVMTHVGYEKIFEIKDKDGNVINAGEASHTINGEIIRTETNTKEVEKTTEISEFTQKTTVTEKDVEKRVTTSTVTMDMDDATRQLVVKLLGASVGEAVIGDNKYVHGDLDGMDTIEPDKDHGWTRADDLWVEQQFHGTNDGTSPNWSWNGAADIDDVNVNAPANEFALTGWGLYGSLYVQRSEMDENGNPIAGTDDPSAARQYILQDETGKDFYALCVEMGQSLDWYNAADGNNNVNYVMENLDEVDYFVGHVDQEALAAAATEEERQAIRDAASEAAKENIRNVVLNGFWGTTGNQTDADGNEIPNTPETGSLEAVRNMLKANGWTEEEANSLTAGQALTATQAAIWHYGNDGGEVLTDLNNIVQYDELKGNNGYQPDSEDNANVVKMFNTLLSLNNVAKTEQESNLIDLEDVTATITAKEKIETGTTDIDNDGKVDDKYNTDVSFTLAVVPTDKDTLMVVVQDSNGNNLVDPIDLNSFAEGTIDPGSTERQNVKSTDGNGNYTYTLGNIQLTEGVSINLNIDGAQYLKQGVYVYRSEGFDTSNTSAPHSQTLVGIAEGYRQVSMDMNLTFSVDEAEDADVNGSRSGYEQTRKDKKYRTDNYVTESREVSALMEVTTTTITTTDQEWEGAYEDEWKYKEDKDEPDTPDVPDTPDTPDAPDDPGTDIPEEDVPLDDTPEGPVDIPEEDVPLADAPEELVDIPEEEVPLIAATGDSNPITGAFGGMFAALAGMFFLRKKKEQ